MAFSTLLHPCQQYHHRPIEHHQGVDCVFTFGPDEELRGWAENDDTDDISFAGVTATYHYYATTTSAPTIPSPHEFAPSRSTGRGTSGSRCRTASEARVGGIMSGAGASGATPLCGTVPVAGGTISTASMLSSSNSTSGKPRSTKSAPVRRSRARERSAVGPAGYARCQIGKTVRQVLEEMRGGCVEPVRRTVTLTEMAPPAPAVKTYGGASSRDRRVMTPEPTAKAVTVIGNSDTESKLCTDMVQALRRTANNPDAAAGEITASNVMPADTCIGDNYDRSFRGDAGRLAGAESNDASIAAAEQPTASSGYCQPDSSEPAAPPYLPSLPNPVPLNQSYRNALQSCNGPTQQLLTLLSQPHSIRYNGSVYVLCSQPPAASPSLMTPQPPQKERIPTPNSRQSPRVPVVTFSAATRGGTRPAPDLTISGTGNRLTERCGTATERDTSSLSSNSQSTSSTSSLASMGRKRAAATYRPSTGGSSRSPSSVSPNQSASCPNLIQRILYSPRRNGVGVSHMLTSAGRAAAAAESDNVGVDPIHLDAGKPWDANKMTLSMAGDALTTRPFHVGLNRLQSARACT